MFVMGPGGNTVTPYAGRRPKGIESSTSGRGRSGCRPPVRAVGTQTTPNLMDLHTRGPTLAHGVETGRCKKTMGEQITKLVFESKYDNEVIDLLRRSSAVGRPHVRTFRSRTTLPGRR